MQSHRFSFLLLFLFPCFIQAQSIYRFPSEEATQEAVWLQWPHAHEYGVMYRNRLDACWTAMAAALAPTEKLHIIAYDATERDRINALLSTASVPTANIDFYLHLTNDVWVRDNGPLFVQDSVGQNHILDLGFNGWGGDYNFNLDDPIPASVASDLSMPLTDLNDLLTGEGGALEMNGEGLMLLTESSLLSQTDPPGVHSIRNPGLSRGIVEAMFTAYFGIHKTIWLDGFFDPYDVTDGHIDGFARFAHGDTFITMSDVDLAYWGLSPADISRLDTISDTAGHPMSIIRLPLTQNDVVTAYGAPLYFKGSYVNYFVANEVLLVPNYNDPNDSIANAILQSVYPDKTVIGIDCRNLYENGGMVHCVTQQQPKAADIGTSIRTSSSSCIKIFPQPLSSGAPLHVEGISDQVKISVFDINGKCLVSDWALDSTGQIKFPKWPAGCYLLQWIEEGHRHQQPLWIR